MEVTVNSKTVGLVKRRFPAEKDRYKSIVRQTEIIACKGQKEIFQGRVLVCLTGEYRLIGDKTPKLAPIRLARDKEEDGVERDSN